MEEKFSTNKTKLIKLCLLVVSLIILYIAVEKFFLYSNSANSSEKYEKTIYALNTQITLTTYGNDDKAKNNGILNKAEQEIYRLEKLLSTTDLQSDIYAINHSEGKSVTVNNESAEIIDFALHMANNTDGALEPTLYPVLRAWGFTTGEYHVLSDKEIQDLLPLVDYKKVKITGNEVTLLDNMQIDLGAVGKGYIGDKIIELLKAENIDSAIVNLGGNVQTLGHKPDGSPWKVGVKAPDSNDFIGIVEVADKAVVTSGGYERFFKGEDKQIYWHILDSTTGKPAHSGLISVTIISQEGKLCDALSTALFVMGKDKAIAYWKQHQDFEMILVAEDSDNAKGNIYISEGLKNTFQVQKAYEDRNIIWVEK